MASDLTGGGMYLVIPYAVAHDMRLSGRAKLLYGEIVRLASAHGYCYASNEALLDILTYVDPDTEAISAITERTLRRLLAELKDRGHIYTDTGPVPNSKGGETTMRRIFVGQRLADCPRNLGGTKMSPPDKNVREGGTKMSPPIISKKNIKGSSPLSPPNALAISQRIAEYVAGDEKLEEAIMGLLENRRAARAPVLTERAMSGILKRLDKYSGGVREAKIWLLDDAVQKGYRTIYESQVRELPKDLTPAAPSKRFLGTKIVDGVEVDVFG